MTEANYGSVPEPSPFPSLHSDCVVIGGIYDSFDFGIGHICIVACIPGWTIISRIWGKMISPFRKGDRNFLPRHV
jgi:hypothetical protein